MSGQETVMKPELMKAVAEFQADFHCLPFYRALTQYLTEEAPVLLQRRKTREALIAFTLVDRTVLAWDSNVVPKFDMNGVFLEWEMTYIQWRNRRDGGLYFKRMSGRRIAFWPFLADALRSLEPSLVPKITEEWDFENLEFRKNLWKRKRVRIFLWTVAQLIKAVTHPD